MRTKQRWTAIVAAMHVVTGCTSEGRTGHMHDITKGRPATGGHVDGTPRGGER